MDLISIPLTSHINHVFAIVRGTNYIVQYFCRIICTFKIMFEKRLSLGNIFPCWIVTILPLKSEAEKHFSRPIIRYAIINDPIVSCNTYPWLSSPVINNRRMLQLARSEFWLGVPSRLVSVRLSSIRLSVRMLAWNPPQIPAPRSPKARRGSGAPII